MKKNAPVPDPTAEYLQARKKFRYSTIWLALGVVYAVWPLDILPDSLPVIGWIDDLTLLLTTFVNSGIRYWRVKSRTGPPHES